MSLKSVGQGPLLVTVIEKLHLIQFQLLTSSCQVRVEEGVMDWSVSVTVQFFSVNNFLLLVWNSMFGNSFYVTWPRTSQTLTMTS